MTSLVCWFAVDSRAITSIYVASDSRITASTGEVLSDAACKVFACRERPDIIGYCGNADRPPAVLARLASQLDGLSVSKSAWDRAHWITRELEHALPLCFDHPYSETKLVYASRDGEGFACAEFRVFEISVVEGHWYLRTLEFSPAREQGDEEHRSRDIAFAEGSGAASVRRWRDMWAQFHSWDIEHREHGGTTRVRTSRGVFSALCTALAFGDDSRSGGAPQLAVIHQEGVAMPLGVIWKGSRFYKGTERSEAEAVALNTRWHDKLFQLCSPTTMAVLEDAACHNAPTRGLDPELPMEVSSARQQRRRQAAARSVEERQIARERHRQRFR